MLTEKEQQEMADFRRRLNEFRRCPTSQEEQAESSQEERKEQK